MLVQLHNNHMGIKEMRLLARELLHWVNMNAEKNQCQHHVTPMASSMHYCIPQVKTIKMRHNMTFGQVT